MTAKEDATLILFTDSYPYDSAAENPFLNPEILIFLIILKT